MSRQNCKNCGEPYNFDNLVTPGRATMKCMACQRLIYIHTGQIYTEPPLSVRMASERGATEEASGKDRLVSAEKNSVLGAVGIVAPGSPASSPNSGGWKRSSKTVSILSSSEARGRELAGSRSEEDWAGDESPLSLYEMGIVGILYLFFIFWFGCAAVVLLRTAYPMEIAGMLVALFAFLGIVSLALAEGLKTLWKNVG